MNQLSNPHYLYLFTSVATQEQVTSYIANLLCSFEETLNFKLDKTFIVNTVFKYDGTPCKHSYVWFKSVQTAGLFLNKDLDGKDRMTEIPDPEQDTTQAEIDYYNFMMAPTPMGARWEDLVETEEKLLKRTHKIMVQKPLPFYITFPGFPLNEEQRLLYPDIEKVEVEFYPCKLFGRPNVSYNKLYAVHVSKDVSESQIRKHFEPFASIKSNCTHQRGAKEYPLVHIDRKSNPNAVLVSYHPTTMDGLFALCMVKKIVLTEKCTLNFDLYREN